jgi:hypothetical protein
VTKSFGTRRPPSWVASARLREASSEPSIPTRTSTGAPPRRALREKTSRTLAFISNGYPRDRKRERSEDRPHEERLEHAVATTPITAKVKPVVIQTARTIRRNSVGQETTATIRGVYESPTDVAPTSGRWGVASAFRFDTR